MPLDRENESNLEADEMDRWGAEQFGKNMMNGFAYCRIITDEKENPVDYVYLYVNDAYGKITGSKIENIWGKRATELFPGIRKDPADWIGKFGRTAITGEPAQFEMLLARGIWYSLSLFSPRKRHFAVLFEDITERKKVEDTIRRLKERFEMAQRAAGVGVWDWDVKTGKIDWTPEMFRLFGLDLRKTPASFAAWESVMHPDDKALAAQKIDQALKGHSSLHNEYRIIRPDGQVVWISALGKGEYDSEGAALRMSGICIDITQLKKGEEELRKAKEDLERRVSKRTIELSMERARLFNVLETLPAYVIILDREHCTRFANKIFRERFGESHGKPCYDFLFKRSSPCENCETYKVLETSRPHRWEWTGPDGRNYDVYDFPFLETDGSKSVLEMGVDITDQKRAIAQIRAASLYARSLIEASLDPLVTISSDGKITDVNEATVNVTGFSREKLIGSDFSNYFTEPKKARRGYQKVFTDGFVKDYPLTIRNKSGKTTDVLYHASVYRNENGQIQGIFAAARDITELKKYREHLEKLVVERTEKLRESEEQFRRAIEEAPIPVIMHAEDGQVLQVSHAWTDLTGFKLTDVPTFDAWLTKSVYGEGANEVRDHMRRLFKGSNRTVNVEFSVRASDGSDMTWSFSASSPGALRDGRHFIVGMAVDITERKQMQAKLEEYAKSLENLVEQRTKELRDSERLAAIGATAGMVGHDIRNPLQAIVGDLYLAKKDLISLPRSETRTSLEESLEAIDEQVGYINKIVQDLQDFAKPLNPAFEKTDLKVIIDDLLKKNELPENIERNVRVESDAAKFVSDPNYVKRILGNLISNAVQAMPKGGNLTIHAHREKADIVIEVKDTGAGIPDAVKDKLFTPLFTTKSKGQGFGLSVVKRLTEALGGSITYESELNKMTVFTVRIPSRNNASIG